MATSHHAVVATTTGAVTARKRRTRRDAPSPVHESARRGPMPCASCGLGARLQPVCRTMGLPAHPLQERCGQSATGLIRFMPVSRVRLFSGVEDLAVF